MPESLHVIVTPQRRVIISQRSEPGEKHPQIEFSESAIDQLIAALDEVRRHHRTEQVIMIPVGRMRRGAKA